jgi:hypothetical protein
VPQLRREVIDPALEKDPDLIEALLRVGQQMPQEAAGIDKIAPMDWGSKLKSNWERDIFAWPNPFRRRMTVNPEWRTLLTDAQQNDPGTTLDDLIAHEMVHSGQQQERGRWGSFMDRVTGRDVETPAYAVEATRRKARLRGGK